MHYEEVKERMSKLFYQLGAEGANKSEIIQAFEEIAGIDKLITNMEQN